MADLKMVGVIGGRVPAQTNDPGRRKEGRSISRNLPWIINSMAKIFV
jgi:hypothetical protein